MAEKSIKARVIQKHDTEENWLKATNFIPKQGELIIYDIDSTHNIERFKIGDGTTTVNNLPFRSIDGGYDVTIELLPETTLNFASNSLTLTNCPPIEVGKKYIVTFDGTEYELVGKLGNDFACIGNESFTWGSIDTGEPFLIFFDIYGNSAPSIYISSSETLPCTHNIKIKAITPIKIDEKYLDIKNTNIVNGGATGSLRTAGSDSEIGQYAFAEGYHTTASGGNSHAEGNSTTASGGNSHAEGLYTTASGSNSHAEGSSSNQFSNVVTATNPTNDDITTAWNSNKFSLAKGDSAHIEGTNNLALGDRSHAEGWYTTASGKVSHAEGYFTIASGDHSHAEGNSRATGIVSHAEGNSTASGGWSHTEGYFTKASDNYSHAEGNETKASGQGSHAEGRGTTASGRYSHTEGSYTEASGFVSHAEGNETAASGDYSHVEGYETKAGQMGFKVTACKKLTDTTGTYTLSSVTGLYKNQRYSVHLSSSKEDCGMITAVDTTNKKITVDGYPDIALSSSSSSTANYLTIVDKPESGDIIISGESSHAEGYYTTALGDHQHVQGKYNIGDSSNTYADIIGNGSSNTRSNAATVDWQGNAWYAGDVYVGSTSGTNRDEGSKKLATEEYVNSAISSGGGSGIVVDSELSSTSVNPVQNKVINTALGTKVDKVSGKGLSTNDYTSAEKTKLSGIESGANKTVVDTALSDTSTNPVQNKVIKSYIDTQLVAITTDEIDSICV